MTARKLLYILIFYLSFTIPAFGATTWTTDVTQAGSGGACVDGGECSVAELNALSGDYSDSVFTFSGTITTEVDPSIYGTAGHVVTFDGNDATTMAARFELGGLDYIRVEDFTFNTGLYNCVHTTIGTLSTGIQVIDCTFGRSPSDGANISFPWVNDSIIAFNTLNSDATAGAGGNIEIRGGKRNIIVGNTVVGGIVGIILKYGRSMNGGGYAGFIEDTVVAGNFVDAYNEEGISFDTVNSTTDAGSMEYDLVSSSTANTVTLSSGGWGDGDDPNYVGFYMGFLDGSLVGEVYQITVQSNAVFTFAETVSSASNGDKIVIMAPFLNNYVGFNRINTKAGDPEDDILLYGNCVGFVVECNEGEDLSGNNDGGEVNVRALRNIYPSSGSVTGYCGQAPHFHNLVLNNTSYDDINVWTYNINQTGCTQVSTLPSTGNTVIGNTTLNGTTGTERLYVAWNNYWESGNTFNDGIYTDSGVTKNISYAYDRPYITGTPTIDATGTIVSITWSETVNLGSYTNGELYITIGTAIDTHIDLNNPTGSGASRLFTAASTILPAQVCKLWFDGTDGSIIDADSNDMTVVGYKTMTNNSASPVIYDPYPTSQQSCGSDPQAVTIGVTSSSNCNCKYSAKGVDTCSTTFANLDTSFSNGEGDTAHNTNVNQACNGSTVYIVKCQDTTTSLISNCIEITVDVAASGGGPPQPAPTGIVPGGNVSIGPSGNVSIQ